MKVREEEKKSAAELDMVTKKNVFKNILQRKKKKNWKQKLVYC